MTSTIIKHEQEFNLLYRLYSDYNSHTNISSITDRDEVYAKHFEDSLSILGLLTIPQPKIIDIGSGGGFPALPLAIVLPQANITALDSTAKKTKFIEQAKTKLELGNLEIINARAEDLAHSNNYREQYDYAVSRAVAELRILLEYCIPYIKVGAKFIAYKKQNIDQEIEAAASAMQTLNTKLIDRVSYDDRQLLIFEKLTTTASNYPRKANQIKKNPL